MPQVINTNIPSLNAQRHLNSSQTNLSQALERLASGLRINSAKDDAAGLSIAERFTTQVRGLNQAIRNANDGISMLQTAEGALAETNNNLQRMRELALQAANSTNSPSDRKALQAEINALQAEITRVADTTTFNNQKILDGNFSQQQFQVGMNLNETITVSVKGARSTQLDNNAVSGANDTTREGTGSASLDSATLAAAAHSIEAQTLSFTTIDGAQSVVVADAASAREIADQINANNGPTGISATSTTTADVYFTAAAGNVSFSLGSSGDGTTTIATSVTNTTDLTTLADAINDASGTTGISAALSTDGATITLTDNNGDDIEIENYTSSLTTGAGIMRVDGSQDTAGAAMLLSGSRDSTVVAGEVTFNSADDFAVQSNVAATAGSLFNAAANTDVASASSSIASVDIGTVAGANSALSVIDSALATVSGIRADLGALQNRFETTITNLQTVSENASAARSQIMDADFAEETAKLTRAQILQQAGVAILSQANAQPQNVLALLS